MLKNEERNDVVNNYVKALFSLYNFIVPIESKYVIVSTIKLCKINLFV